MLNQTGVVSISANTRKTILVDQKNCTSFSVVVNDTGVDADAEGKKIIKAGTPMSGSLTARNTPFVVAGTEGGTAGTWTLAISTAFAEDEKLTINDVEYTCGAAESSANKVFAGANATAQAASLVNIISDSVFTLTASSGTITFTQKTPDASGDAPTASTTATTGAIGTVTAGQTPVSGTTNANCLILHDVDVTGLEVGETRNSQVLVAGFVDISKLDASVQALITSDVAVALKMIRFVK